MSTATRIEMTNEEYHAHPAIGASMLETFRESRRAYHAYYVAKSESRPAPSEAMKLGTWIHSRILEPDLYFEALAELPPENAPDGKKWLRRKGSDHERWWNEFLERNKGKEVIDAETRQLIEMCASAVMDNKTAHRLLTLGGSKEHSIFWTDRDTGLECKCRVDSMAKFPVDLKTSKDPSPRKYAADCVRLGYHRKRAHYQAGIFAETGEHHPFVHIVIKNRPFYEVGIYNLDDDHFMTGASLGQEEYRQTMHELAHCIETDNWQHEWERGITDLRIPAWAWGDADYQLTQGD